MIDIETCRNPHRGKPLSAREREVARLIQEGHATKEIAFRLGIAYGTAAAHRYNLMAKLEAHNVAQLLLKLAA